MGNKSKRNVYHVTSNSDKGWKVKKEAASTNGLCRVFRILINTASNVHRL